jgi:DNA-binding NtrC family response regulator
MTKSRVLIVDDEPEICRLVQEILVDEGYEVLTAENASAAREKREEFNPDLILLDIWMPDTDGITLLKEWVDNQTSLPAVVMMSGHGNVETAVEAIRYGAYDFLEKPLSLAKLIVTVERALQAAELRTENIDLRKQLEPATDLIGNSEAMQHLRDQIERVAQTESWILISGNPGSGKEVAARQIHKLSPRSNASFVVINLAAVPTENIAVQLFGMEKDGHVTAGSFEQASGGTLFLDEIADLDLETQAKLAGALEEHRFLRVGGSTPIDLDVRVIAATNRQLDEEVRDKRFREDLYYRLNVVPIHIPPLRQRPEDIAPLVDYLLDNLVQQEKLPYRRFGTAALNTLRQHSWPGNVRELKNMIQRLLILNRGEEVSASEVEQAIGRRLTADEQTGYTGDWDLPLRDARDQFERSYLEYHLKKVAGNVSELANVAGMERTHLYRKLKALNINPKLSRG